MLLVKDQGGCTVAGYTWENDGDAVDVPYDLAVELTGIRGGDFSVAGDQEVPAGLSGAPKTRRKAKAVTEPAPAPAAAVTEPAPDAEVTEPGGE